MLIFLQKYLTSCFRVSTFFLACSVSAVCLFQGCNNKKDISPIFTVLKSEQTGLDFTNTLSSSDSFNVFKYMYFYNGAGIGAGDFNNDGKIDLFFASNQGGDRLYLNEGNLHFADKTLAARIPQDKGWSTGVSVVDINNDGLLDLYICRVGKHETLNSHNELLICQGMDKDGIPFYVDKSKEYGLDFSGFSTQAAFFDYDGDGDLDMYLLNHFIHQNGNFGIRQQLLARPTLLSGDRMYRNDNNGVFSDVTKQSGINSSVLGYGLGIAVADINLDGFPDLYIGNDFHENDYLYINGHDGTFQDDLSKHIMHTSQYSMGVDVADINNDGFPEIISMDMLPADPYILKRSLGEDAYDLFYQKIGYGYNYQYTRNNLQLNRKNGMFSELGLYAGVAATDWSWAPLWMDFDNDGVKDLFISNGIPKRMNDIDYINYLSNEDIQEMIRDNKLDKKNEQLIEKFPHIKIPNKFFHNNGNLLFGDMKEEIKNDQPTYSSGAVYADFDGDGDLDIVVNNIEDPALLYENNSSLKKDSSSLTITLKGPERNINAVGAKLIVYANEEVRTYEKYPVRGFLSSMETPMQIGLRKTTIDSVFVIWPDNTFESVTPKPGIKNIHLEYKPNLRNFDYDRLSRHFKIASNRMIDITASSNLSYQHIENPFSEFDREPLIPHKFSTEGPGLAIADINHDGWDDVFIGSSKTNKSAIFLQGANEKFSRSIQPALANDSAYEDVGACWTDINNDGHPDLVVASGGNEYYGPDFHLKPRLYLNDGKGELIKSEDAFGDIFLTASCVISSDFNGDGYADLFIGGRSVPWDYGKPPRSYLLMNDRKQHFVDATETYAKGLEYAGFVTGAQWVDIDNDGDEDLVLCSEWGGIDVFLNTRGRFSKKVLSGKKGWWNCIKSCDINHDGQVDFIVGNLGLNSRLKASEAEPVKMYYFDFDGNGKKEQVLSYYLNGKEIPFANKSELERQLPFLKKKFLYAEELATATFDKIFSSAMLEKAEILSASYFSNAVLLNRGNFSFELRALPWEAQLSTIRDAVTVEFRNDTLPEMLLVGNYFDNNIEMGRYDADFGTVLSNHGKDSFTCAPINGIAIKGEVRHVAPINLAGGSKAIVIARNNDSAMLIKYQNAENKLRKETQAFKTPAGK